MDSSLRGAAARAEDHPVLTIGARLGYAASGVLHLVLGWITVGLAWGTSSGSADQTGALEQLGSSPLGSVLLWVGGGGGVRPARAGGSSRRRSPCTVRRTG